MSRKIYQTRSQRAKNIKTLEKECKMCSSGKIFIENMKHKLEQINCPSCNYPLCDICGRKNYIKNSCGECIGPMCTTCGDRKKVVKSGQLVPCRKCVCTKCWGAKYLTTRNEHDCVDTYPCNECTLFA